MIDCKNCVKNDVCKHSVGLQEKIKSLSNCHEMQVLNMFKFSLELGGNYEQ